MMIPSDSWWFVAFVVLLSLLVGAVIGYVVATLRKELTRHRRFKVEVSVQANDDE